MIPANFTVLDVFVDDKESPLVRPKRSLTKVDRADEHRSCFEETASVFAAGWGDIERSLTCYGDFGKNVSLGLRNIFVA